jgi:hypothetical protein
MNSDQPTQFKLADSLKATFTPLPSDPYECLTQEQLDALFPCKNRIVFMRELLRLVQTAAHTELEAAS